MSLEATRAVWSWPCTGSDKLIALALADCHNGQSGRCDPSVARLIQMTGLSKRAVLYAVRALEAAKLVTPDRRTGCRTRYLLDLDRCNPCTGAIRAPVQTVHRTGANGAPPPVQTVHPTGANLAPEPEVTGSRTGIEQEGGKLIAVSPTANAVSPLPSRVRQKTANSTAPVEPLNGKPETPRSTPAGRNKVRALLEAKGILTDTMSVERLATFPLDHIADQIPNLPYRGYSKECQPPNTASELLRLVHGAARNARKREAAAHAEAKRLANLTAARRLQ